MKKTRKRSRGTRTLVRLDTIRIANNAGEEPALIERVAHLVCLQPEAAIELHGTCVSGQRSFGQENRATSDRTHDVVALLEARACQLKREHEYQDEARTV